MISQTVEHFPDKDAFMWKVDGVYQTMTYSEFYKKIYNFASGLAELGIKKDDKVGILANSTPMWGISDFALASLGAVSVPVYPTLPPEGIAYTLDNADVHMVVLEDEEQLDKVIESKAELDKNIIMYPSDSFTSSDSQLTFSEVEQLGAENPIKDWEEEWRKIDRDQLLTIIHTSGTTGNPKGAMLTHGNMLANLEGVQFWLIELLPEDVSLSYLPISHVFERMAGHYLPLSVGVTIAYAESIDTIPENLQEVRPTVLTSVPRLFEKVYAQVQEEIKSGSAIKQRIFNWALSVGLERYEYYLDSKFDQFLTQDYMPKSLYRKWKIADRLVFRKIKEQLGGRLRGMVSGGGTLNPEFARFFWALDLPLLEGYGLTETAPVITTNPMIKSKAGTVGKVLPNLHVRLAEDGEIEVKGPSIMKGYYNDPEETEEVFDGEWFATGDLGEFDEDGYLKVIDRKKRLLVLSTGMNVAPQPIESKMNESSYIEQSVVLGDNEKFVICLVNPAYENLVPWAERRGIQTESYEELCNHKDVIELLESEVERLTSHLISYAQPKMVLIAPDEWTIDSGELTPKLSIRLSTVEEKYKDLIEAAYEEEDSQEGETA